VLFSSDQSFPLAGAFAYSVYQFQSKRVKRDPEGPFLGGNAIVGAILSTLLCLAVACGVSGVGCVCRGWWLGGGGEVGAILSHLLCLAVACGVSAEGGARGVGWGKQRGGCSMEQRGVGEGGLPQMREGWRQGGRRTRRG
jgi:hypothetical protein